VTETNKLLPYHIGEKFGPGMIIDDIKKAIAEAKVIIAEITEPKENVFYELGLAHGLNKLQAITSPALPAIT
jgi:hypothetical protein